MLVEKHELIPAFHALRRAAGIRTENLVFFPPFEIKFLLTLWIWMFLSECSNLLLPFFVDLDFSVIFFVFRDASERLQSKNYLYVV